MSKVVHAQSVSLVGVLQESRDGDNRWCNLPHELLSLILRYVHYNNYYQFQATCTSWQNVSPSPLLRPHQNPRLQAPWLLFYGSTQTYKFFNPLYNITCQTRGLESSQSIVHAFGHGWLLMAARNGNGIFLLDPIAQVKIKIPKKPSNVRFHRMCLSSSPTSSDCLIVGVSVTLGTIHIGVIKRGEDNWAIERFQTPDFHLSDSSPIFYGGRCYCLDRFGKLGVFDPHNVRDSWHIYKQSVLRNRHKNALRHSFLVKGNEEIFSVFVYGGGSKRAGGNRHVSVHKLDIGEMTFEAVDDLGDRMLWVSGATSILSTSVISGMGNKIYFPRFDD